MSTLQQFEGCLLGLALGDALGAPFEGGPLERLLWKLIGKTSDGKMRWTDDTQMSLDLADSLLAKGKLEPDDLADRFAAGYRWRRGYGPGAAKVLKRIAGGADWQTASRSVYPTGSFGNGGAMRAPVIALFYADRPAELIEAARLSARITHAHPLGIEGAVLIAATTAKALTTDNRGEILGATEAVCCELPYQEKLKIARDWLDAGKPSEAKDVRQKLGNGIAATESVITAIYIALRFLDKSFPDMLAFVRECAGDVDTIGAMAGAIWGATNGSSALPENRLKQLEQSERLTTSAGKLYKTSLLSTKS